VVNSRATVREVALLRAVFLSLLSAVLPSPTNPECHLTISLNTGPSWAADRPRRYLAVTQSIRSNETPRPIIL
jgi:hypothetical protein